MKKSTIFLLILVAVFFTSTLVLLYQNQVKNPSVTLTSQTGLTPTTTPTYPTADWKKYEDTQFGISFYYPNKWSVVKKPNELLIISPETSKNLLDSNNTWTRVGDIIITKITEDKLPNNKTKLPLNQWINSEEAKNYGINQPAELYNLGGLKGYKVISCAEMCVEEVYLEGNNIIFEIDSGNYDRFTGELSQILSTFKFTNPTADWKTYTDSINGFSFKYPPTWFLKTTPNNTTINSPETIKILAQNSENLSDFYISKELNILPRYQNVELWLNDQSTVNKKTIKKILLGGKTVYQYEECGEYCSKKVIFPVTNGYYQISCTDYGDDANPLIAERLLIFDQTLSTFKFTITKEETALDVAKIFLDAYIKGDWTTVKSLCADTNFDERIASSYGITKYTIINSKIDAKDQNYYHVYIDLTTSDGQIHKISPGGTQIEVLMHKNTSGNWKALTWYFFQ